MTSTINYVNPAATNEQLTSLATAFNDLTTNTVTDITRIDRNSLTSSGKLDRDLKFEDETTTKTIQGSTLSSNANEPTALEITGNGLSNSNIIVNRLVAADAQGYVFSDWSAYSDTNMSIFLLRDAQSEVPETTITITVPATDSYKEGTLTINITAAT